MKKNSDVIRTMKQNYMRDSSYLFFENVSDKNLCQSNIAKFLGVNRSLINRNLLGDSQIELWEVIVLYDLGIADLTPCLLPGCTPYSKNGKQLNATIKSHTYFFKNNCSFEKRKSEQPNLKKAINDLLSDRLVYEMNNRNLSCCQLLNILNNSTCDKTGHSSIEIIDFSLIDKYTKKERNIQPWFIRSIYHTQKINLIDSLFK